jgi:hypothetical protein
MTTMILNPADVKLIHGDYTKSSDFENLIIEFDGCTKMDAEFIEVESTNGSKIVITYDIQIEGHSYTERGDYFTPDYTSVEIDSVDVDIQSVEIDENEIELTKELESIFEKIVKKLI